MHKPAIAFDFDGTIIDISRRDYAVYHDLMQDLSGSALPFGIYWPMRRKRGTHKYFSSTEGFID